MFRIKLCGNQIGSILSVLTYSCPKVNTKCFSSLSLKDRERLLKELEQMQNVDRMRRRQRVAQMPPQLFVPAYKRMEIKDDWQRELEFAFEDMYSEDRRE